MTDRNLSHEVQRHLSDDADFYRQMRRADTFLWLIVVICVTGVIVLAVAAW